MTETSYYPPTASSRRPGGTGAAGPVLVAVDGPSAQRRATVAVRAILAVPHVFALYFLGIAAGVIAVIGWLCALVTGRLPRFAATYLSGYLRWSLRVGAYLLLLTDQYPPFAFGDAAYPVRLAVGPGKLNRLTVLVRLLLAIPAAIVSVLLTSGFTTIVIFIAWLTALIAGRLPASLHQAFAAVLRYTTRYYGYLYLLTGAYPAGLFGDEPDAPGQAAGWRLALSPGAKRLTGLFLVLGVLTAAGAGAWTGVTINAIRQRNAEISQLRTDVAHFNPVVARHNAAVARLLQANSQEENASLTLDEAHNTLVGVLNSPGSDSSDCATVNCFNVTSLPGAKAFSAFGSTLRATPVPPGSAAIAKRLTAETASTAQDWTEMATADSFTSVENFATAAENVGGKFDNDFSALETSLENEGVTLSAEANTLNNVAATLNHQAAALSRRAVALNVTVSVRAASDAALSLGGGTAGAWPGILTGATRGAGAGWWTSMASGQSATESGRFTTMSAHQLDQAVFGQVLPEDIDWEPFPSFPPPARLAVVVGRPAEPAPYVVRVKVPSGVKLMPHRHHEDRVYTVMSGVFYIGVGEQFDEGKLRAYPPGAVIVLPGGTPHFHWAKSGEYVTQVTALGPISLEYVDPHDDPRNK
jgi:quercetin dioxygenase-like cupin family protein